MREKKKKLFKENGKIGSSWKQMLLTHRNVPPPHHHAELGARYRFSDIDLCKAPSARTIKLLLNGEIIVSYTRRTVHQYFMYGGLHQNTRTSSPIFQAQKVLCTRIEP